MQYATEQTRPVTAGRLREMKAQGEKIGVLTAYDATFAAVLDETGVDAVLVGDSLGNVIQGRDSTLPVTVEDMIYHTACVRRGLRRALLIADMPFLSFSDPATALHNAGRLIKEAQANMVKVEGAGYVVEVVQQLKDHEIPVCGHLGLTPQSVLRFGGYKVQGRGEAAASQLLADAVALSQAGADLLVLECVPRDLAVRVTRELDIPTIGIGAGPDTDGQVLVLQDMLGLTRGRTAKFVRDFMVEADDVPGAVAAYLAAVRDGSYPADEHSYD